MKNSKFIEGWNTGMELRAEILQQLLKKLRTCGLRKDSAYGFEVQQQTEKLNGMKQLDIYNGVTGV